MRDRGWRRFTAWKKDKRMRQIIQRERYFASSSRTIQERKKSHVSHTYIKGCYREQLRRTLKRQSRKKLRHTKDLTLRGNGFHKCFDYWWITAACLSPWKAPSLEEQPARFKWPGQRTFPSCGFTPLPHKGRGDFLAHNSRNRPHNRFSGIPQQAR